MPVIINNNEYLEVSEEVYQDWHNSLIIKYNKDLHIAEINQAHDELVKSVLSTYNYTDMSELVLWASQPDNMYHSEANSIIEWYRQTCIEIETYSNVVTENTQIPVNQFINNLQKYC